MMKILTIIGARPQIIKAAAVSRVIGRSPGADEIILHTGQHFDGNMSAHFFEEMGIPEPKYNLGLGGLSHGAMTGRMIEGIEKIVEFEKPDYILVYGDTNSTLAGALVAAKCHIKLAHVEAGLRSGNSLMPEEINRIVTDRLSNLLFCPTDVSINNLLLEGYELFKGKKIFSVGDVMLDNAIHYSNLAVMPKALIDIEPGSFILTTIHRAETTDNEENLKNVITALNILQQEIDVIMPIHPRTKNKIEEYGLSINFHIIDPVGYLEMIWLLKNSERVVTDSGGVQKEAYFFKKRCVIVRTETEWVELVSSGWNVLAGYDSDIIINESRKISRNLKYVPLYGDGNAAETIIGEMQKYAHLDT